MSLLQLSEDQLKTLSVAEKDRWWLESVYRGDAPQLTVRVVLGGFVIGGLLAVMNLYVGARIGASLGTSITAVVIGFLVFGSLHRMGLIGNYGVLEGVMLQSIACSAGYMCSPLTASMAAYMVVTDTIVPWWQMILWLLGLSVLGVTFAIPFKRRFINNEQMPFPEGRACAVVLDMLHHGDASNQASGAKINQISQQSGMNPARLLVVFGLGAGLIKFLQSHAILDRLRIGFLSIPELLDGWYYRLATSRGLWTPAIAGIPLRELTIRPTLDIAMMALGGFMGMRTCLSLMIGATVNYFVLAPWMVQRGDIVSRVSTDGSMLVGFRAITTWSLWCGTALMTCASLWSFFMSSKQLAVSLRRSKNIGSGAADDVLKDIELPNSLFLVAGPIAAIAVVWMAHLFFGVAIWLALLAIPLVLAMTLIAVNATALTSMTPHGALGKITQLAVGTLAPKSISTNIAAAGISAEVALQASNLIQNIKPGYILGAKPRLQAIGHLIGAVSGACIGVSVFYPLFLKSSPSTLVSEEYPFPAVIVWKAVAEALAGGLNGLPTSAICAAIIGGIVGIAVDAARLGFKGRFSLSSVSMGLAFIIPFDISMAMFVGATIFWLCGKYQPRPEQWLNRVILQNQEVICAGVVAGAAIVGVGVTAIDAF